MKTKLVYVVVSDETDSYLEQVLLSVASARQHNADAYIELVVDETTSKTLIVSRAKIKDYIDNLHVVSLPKEYSKMECSRHLKTNLRNIVEGDYLFLDTDTIICDSLDKTDLFQCDICAAKESNRYASLSLDGSDSAIYMYRLAESVGIQDQIINQPYFNSGVIYAKDTETAHKLYTNWHNNWQEFRKKGLKTDQTAFCLANVQTNKPIVHLDDIWNCQILKDGINSIENAKIIHYFYSLPSNNYLLAKDYILQSIKDEGGIPTWIEELLQNPFDCFVIDAETMKYLRSIKYTRQIYNTSPRFYGVLEYIAHIYMYIYRKINKRKQR